MLGDQDQAVIIGNGAIGTALYHRLERLGLTVGFVTRLGPVAWQAQFAGTPPVAAPRIELSSARIVLAVVAVKAFDLETALAWTMQLPPGAVVWPLSNGAVTEVVEVAAARRKDLEWRLGYCTFGVTALGPASYQAGSAGGELGVGPLHGSTGLSPLEQSWLTREPLFKWHPRIIWMHHRKWLFNTAINTLAAARRLPTNGLLLGDLPMLAAVFSEALALGQQLWGPWPQPRDELYAALLQLIQATAGNENSMARDVRLARRTESLFLAGLAKDERIYPLLTSLHQRITQGQKYV
jgi:ketopantoate reductase